jgi:hypothetical protein
LGRAAVFGAVGGGKKWGFFVAYKDKRDGTTKTPGFFPSKRGWAEGGGDGLMGCGFHLIRSPFLRFLAIS